MIHVCVAIHDSDGQYSKYGAVTICSLFENTCKPICVHILCDSTIGEDTRSFFYELAQKYNQKIVFYDVPVDRLLQFGKMLSGYTIGSMFRLYLFDIIPQSITKVLYLDTDIVVNMDIDEIWRTDLTGYACAACPDEGIKYSRDSFYLHWDNMAVGEYFNSGVMLFNIEYIKQKYDLLNDCIDFLTNHKECKMPDQDAMNTLFYGKVIYLKKEYNMATRFMRGKNALVRNGIYHFAGDYCNPVEMEVFDRLFYHYLYLLHKEQWIIGYYTNYLQEVHRSILVYQSLLKRIAGKNMKKVFWGANSIYFNKVLHLTNVNVEYDYIVDSNTQIHGNKICGMTVYHPRRLFDEAKGDWVVIVVSKKFYPEIRIELQGHGFVENEDFFDGIALLSMSQGGYGRYY